MNNSWMAASGSFIPAGYLLASLSLRAAYRAENEPESVFDGVFTGVCASAHDALKRMPKQAGIIRLFMVHHRIGRRDKHCS